MSFTSFEFMIVYGTYYSIAGSNGNKTTERRAVHSWRNPGALGQVNTQAMLSSNLSLDNPLMA